MAAKNAWLVTAVSPPSEGTQPRRRAGFLVKNCENPKEMLHSDTVKTKLGQKNKKMNKESELKYMEDTDFST